MDIDKMLEKAGDFGCYQIFLMFLFSIVNILSAFHYFSQTFISVIPEHWCNTSEIGDISLNETVVQSIKDYLAPLPDQSCMRFEWNDTGEHASPRMLAEDLPVARNLEKGWTPVKCESGWIYNRYNGFESIVSELDWVCDDDWKPVLAQALFGVGSVVGTLVLGILADVIGRLPVLSIANVLAVVGNVATVFAHSFPLFAACRFLSGMASDSNFVMMYIIVMEYVRPSMRTFGLNLCIGVFYCLGCVIVPLVAIALVTWRHFLLATTVPMVVVVTFYFMIPESAQWLVSRGRAREAVECFVKIARRNGRTISPGCMDAFIAESDARPKPTRPSLIGLFLTPRLRKNYCILIFKSMVLTLCYDAISRNVNGLGYSPFILFSFSSMTILPSCLVILALQDKIGRKAMASSSLLVTGLFTAISGGLLYLNSNTDPLLAVCMAALGRFGVNVAYNSGAQYAAELIPTEVRGQGIAAAHVAGYAATFFSPYIIYLGSYSLAIPPLILGSLAIMCAGLCLLLPETLGRSLPTTLQDGEEFGQGERLWDFACVKTMSTSTAELVTDYK